MVICCFQRSFLKSVSLSKSVTLFSTSARNFCLLNRMATTTDFDRLKEKQQYTEKLLFELRNQIEAIKKVAVKQAGLPEEENLIKENEALRKEIDSVKTALFIAEIGNGVRQVQLPSKGVLSTILSPKLATVSSTQVKGTAKESSPSAAVESKPKEQQAEANGKKTKKETVNAGGKKAKTEENKEKTAKDAGGDGSSKKKTAATEGETADSAVDISKLDLRVGKIVAVEKHPDADSLYVEQVDVGEGKNRTVVSGLVKHVPINAMKDRIAVFMCNLKPAKMRGVLSEGMIMCAVGAEKTEILVPPTDSVIGDRVTFDDYPGTPEAQLNPKKKIWETLKPDVRTNEDRVATYKGAPFVIKGKGFVVAPTLANSQIS
ncbi:aminoacyl tRNA synthase complex-interacting multifunctional protein 1-like [Physella acuta]|uniref:aminoacyl tRNA synthase complex-interacting multifunctional protein 1-like n=1 Tax=Physella acuta TaxID=109671 RepID=UPI0027DC4118|nr:aminoacyl tRNA synthase complex-interacting multifunctional protein 1-like [Physella acuta]